MKQLIEKLQLHNINRRNGDLSIVALVALLVIFGTVMIFSASYYPSATNYYNPYYFLKRQLLWLAISSVAMWFCAQVDYHFWARLWIIAPFVCTVLLILVLTPLGEAAYGSVRWIPLGPITIMPGELAKVGIILFTTGYFSRHPKRAVNFGNGVLPIVCVAGLYAGLIMCQPNMSTAFTIIMIAGGMLLVAGIRWIHVAILGVGAGLAGFALIFMDSDGYRLQRFMSFLDPFADSLGNGWQVVQSLLALGTGGLTGLGLGNSVQKNLYLPMAQNDFILAIIGEELGFVGVACLIAVYLILVWRGCHTAMNAADYTGMMLASGIIIMVGIQVVINIAVVTSCMPPTGIILPFVSYGGNALMIFMSAMGVLVNISKSSNI